MCDVKSQYIRLRNSLDFAMKAVLESGNYIKGEPLKEFELNFANYLGVKHVIGVANGTDALQIAMMASDLVPGDEVIIPAFTYVATAEVIALLGLVPRLADVDVDTFNINVSSAKNLITERTKAIVPVHLFGQSAAMDEIIDLAKTHNLTVIEDNAQSIGSNYTREGGLVVKTGTMGDIGCTSFFPTKNLGCFGDGGAVYTNDDELAAKVRMIANHGQRKKYYHDLIGVNSRLDTLQACVLNVKLLELEDFSKRRNEVAVRYNKAFQHIDGIQIPTVLSSNDHVYHQYTLKLDNKIRDDLQQHLAEQGVSSVIYYPLPIHQQKAYEKYAKSFDLSVSERLCSSVLSLPIHTEMKSETQDYIIKQVLNYFEPN